VWVNDLRGEDGRVYAFEVSSVIGRRRACEVASRIPGVTVLERPKRFSFGGGPDQFCRFELDGQVFVIWEPFGDNSRYWIGPEAAAWCPQFDRVREAFAAASGWPWPFTSLAV
jgi:hypothetical protein